MRRFPLAFSHHHRSARLAAPPVLFREVQQFKQWWLRYLLAPLIAMALVALIIFTITFTNDPNLLTILNSLVALVLVLIIILLITLKLETTVYPGGLHIRFGPFFNRAIPCEELAHWEAVTYRPQRDYGGWGFRYGHGATALNVSGDKGVLLVFRDGKRLMLGSQRHQELAEAITQATRF